MKMLLTNIYSDDSDSEWDIKYESDYDDNDGSKHERNHSEIHNKTRVRGLFKVLKGVKKIVRPNYNSDAEGEFGRHRINNYNSDSEGEFGRHRENHYNILFEDEFGNVTKLKRRARLKGYNKTNKRNRSRSYKNKTNKASTRNLFSSSDNEYGSDYYDDDYYYYSDGNRHVKSNILQVWSLSSFIHGIFLIFWNLLKTFGIRKSRS